MHNTKRRLALIGLIAAVLTSAAVGTTLFVLAQNKKGVSARQAQTGGPAAIGSDKQGQQDAAREESESGDYNSDEEEIRDLAANGVEARQELARMFAARSWQAIGRRDYRLGARYALAGWRAAPAIEGRYRAALHRILGVEESRVLRGHEGQVVHAAFSPDGSQVVTASRDHTARLWDTRTGRELAVLRGHTRDLRSAAFSADGKRILTIAEGHTYNSAGDRVVRVWDIAGRLTATLAHEADVNGAAFSPDGARIATASDMARLWDARTGRLIAAMDGPGSPVHGVAFSRSGERIVAVEDRAAIVWDAATGRRVALMRDAEEDGGGVATGVRFALFSPDGRVIALSEGGIAHVWRTWDAANGRQLEGQCCSDIAIPSSDGAYMLEASRWGSFTIRGLVNSRKTAGLFEDENENAVTGFAISSDGARLVSLSDHVARMWDFDSGRELAALRGHDGWISSVVFSPDGIRILTASWDKTARIWDVARLLRPMPDVVRTTCADFLDASARRFSAEEIAADPLIRIVWLGGRSENRDVCEGAGARTR